jgi:cell division protein FtsQ
MLALTGRLVYFFLADARYFPINTVKIAATYQHVTRQQLESILSKHLNQGFFGFSTHALTHDLLALAWSEDIDVQRIWPDAVKITLTEKEPVAVWNGELMTENGYVFHPEHAADERERLPQLTGPQTQQKDVLQNYQKFSKLLTAYGLSANALQLRDNQAWDLFLANGVLIRLGKRDLEQRLLRFCRAYPAVFADKSEQLSSVDLRYARGMAVQWKQQTGK